MVLDHPIRIKEIVGSLSYTANTANTFLNFNIQTGQNNVFTQNFTPSSDTSHGSKYSEKFRNVWQYLLK